MVAVTGVSGSGKSTLINDILLRSLAHTVNRSKAVPGLHRAVRGWSRSTRWSTSTRRPSAGRPGPTRPPTPASSTTSASSSARRPRPRCGATSPGGSRSTSKAGGASRAPATAPCASRCTSCPTSTCPARCATGPGYNRDTLEVTFRGKTIADVLDMSCEEGLAFFAHQPPIARHLQTLVDVGLGYIRLGQSAPTLSGGEAQRVKLASELSRRSTGTGVLRAGRADHGAPLRGRPQAPRGPRPPGRPGQHGGGDRAQPRRDQVLGLGHRPGARGRRPGRHHRGRRHARGGRGRGRQLHRAGPGPAARRHGAGVPAAPSAGNRRKRAAKPTDARTTTVATATATATKPRPPRPRRRAKPRPHGPTACRRPPRPTPRRSRRPPRSPRPRRRGEGHRGPTAAIGAGERPGPATSRPATRSA